MTTQTLSQPAQTTAHTSSPSPPSSTSPLLHQLQTHGYVIIRNLLAPTQVSSLRTACQKAIHLATTGHYPYARHLPKQFPPWPAATPETPPPQGIWGVQHLLHPSLPLELRQEFAKAYFSTDGVLDIAAQLLAAPGAPGKGKEKERCPDEELVLELWNLLCAPTRDVPFELKWHRDDIDIHRVCVAEEAAELARRKGIETAKGGGTHTQWNLALYPDSSLLVVPGSHLRPRTAVEAAALNADPWCPLEELEGAIAAELGPGDCVFYDNNILHRGVYEPASKRERATLHGSVGHVRAGEGGGKGNVRARNVLQHGISWIGEVDFGELLDGEKERSRAEEMRRRLVEMGGGKTEKEVGFSLEG